MRYLGRNPNAAKPIALVSMREETDCFTCVTAMLLGLTYKEVESAFGGNIDPSKGQDEASRFQEASRLQEAFAVLLEKHNRGMLQLPNVPPITQGRRYWVGVQIDDPSKPLSLTMSHGIVIDEQGKVFDPNPQYGEFKSLDEWEAAMTLPHRIDHATEVFEYAL
jgi:hypothetical protein